LNQDDSFSSLGYEFWCAAKLLSSTPSTTSSSDVVTYYLYGHAAELFLKAFLASKGVSAKALKLNYGHDLQKLVNEAEVRDLDKTLVLAELKRFSKLYDDKLLEYRQARLMEFPLLGTLEGEIEALYAAVFDATVDFDGNN